MKFASFLLEGRRGWGLVDNDAVAVLSALEDGRYPDLKSAIAADALHPLAARAAEAPVRALGDLDLLPVIPNPDKILCIGLNYEDHRRETGRAEVAHPTVFTRFANTLVGHGAPVLMPRLTSNVDYEGELAIVIGRPARHVARQDGWAHVAGLSIFNDVSMRDFQSHTTQFTPGKNFPASGPFGPWMVTPDEMPDFGARRIETRLNGAIVQQAVFDQMIFDIGRIIEYCSSFTQLEPGDVIATGTPGGVGYKRTPPLWLKPGDTVSIEIEGIGTLTNPVSAEP